MFKKDDNSTSNFSFLYPTGEYRFLGTFAGEQSFSFCKTISNNTYTRVYKSFGCSSELRDDIAKQEQKEMGGEGFKKIGEVYSFTPISKRDGRLFGDGTNCNNVRTDLVGGGFFLTVKKYTQKDSEYHFKSFNYAISQYPELEKLANENMQTLLKQTYAYGINYIVHQYFQGVEFPQDGDLVVYEEDGKPSHAGIYRMSTPNWNSPGGGTVESKWHLFSNPYVFQHDVFFLPNYLGNTAKFYRLRDQSTLDQSLQYNMTQATINYHFDPDNFLVFDETDIEIDTKRKDLDNLSSDEIVSKFPEIKRLDYINFFGVCYHYALGKVFNTYSGSEIPSDPTSDKKFIEKNFINVVTPQPGDLVVYYTAPQNQSAVHYGIYYGCVESKWGVDSIYRHPLSLAPKQYGKYLKFWRLKSTAEKKSMDVDLPQNKQKFK